MPSLTPAELSEARRRSGNFGGRPRKPTVSEARLMKLEELVPKALQRLDENLDSENEHVRQRAVDSVLDRAWGKPLQAIRTEADLTSSSPFDALPDDVRDEWIRAARAHVALVEGQAAESENGSTAS